MQRALGFVGAVGAVLGSDVVQLPATAEASGFSTCFVTGDGMFVSASPEGLG